MPLREIKDMDENEAVNSDEWDEGSVKNRSGNGEERFMGFEHEFDMEVDNEMVNGVDEDVDDEAEEVEDPEAEIEEEEEAEIDDGNDYDDDDYSSLSPEESFRPQKQNRSSRKSRMRNVKDKISKKRSVNRKSKRIRKTPWDFGRTPIRRGLCGWEDSLRSQPAQTQHYQSIQLETKRIRRNDPEPEHPRKCKNLNARMKAIEEPTSKEKRKTTRGDLVWGKLNNCRWWPAIVISEEDCGQTVTQEGHTWVFWFGDHRISELQDDKLLAFRGTFSSTYSESKRITYKRGIEEALQECLLRGQIKDVDDKNYASLVKWAKNGFNTKQNNSNINFYPDPAQPLPHLVLKELLKITVTIPDSPGLEVIRKETGIIDDIHKGILKIQDICISCTSKATVVTQHPYFEGGLCEHCKQDLTETMVSYGDDETNMFCVICGSAGELLICDKPKCPRVFCSVCIKTFANDKALKRALKSNPWHCFCCADYDEELNGLIKKKPDWRTNVAYFFQTSTFYKNIPITNFSEGRKPIKVLSLFDGIGTGHLCLERLGIKMEAYYACETDKDSINVAQINHPFIVQLGSVQDLTDDKIAELGPFDLVIGGSPCNDLSLVNPARRGLYNPEGTGILFFDFYRILRTAQLSHPFHHTFWLFENVYSMPQPYKDVITSFLQCEPASINANVVSPQNRTRYYWGNIPGLHSPGHMQSKNETVLQDVLRPHCNRIALVDKVRTITTKSNSLKQKKGVEYPVAMNGVADTLWATEIEAIFGYPLHYTDVGNLSITQRQTLLGKAWSVPVIRDILKPLCEFYLVEEVEDNY